MIPAIDIKGGRIVRYAEGGPDTVYRLDPVGTAEAFVADGARWLHLADLDRAFDTGRDNDAVVRRIVGLQGARVQVGGRLRGPDQVARALELGAARAVVATGAAADPRIWEAITAAVDPSRLAVAVDVRQGRLVHRGSDQPPASAPDALVRRAVAAGVRAVIHRDLQRDGELAGPDLDGAARLLGLGADVVAAGGIGKAAHLIAARDAGLAGVIVGRAFYQGRLTLREALACLA
ncbi:MAG: 1-(5-phosphoribosyl)-5-((5-phosphoribosylamino)methylideneamino)imidazole-4-carboxamide isomerase [Gemmatimonadetes bacterium]|nr:1-(5-phosphoribosyl)-5-((5-phosphoribosylamino)methylideneamino)imidazole-4-carboxamide isomerase [Gemmatimonadota bacterium]